MGLAAAAVIVVADALALSNLHAGLGVVCCGSTHALLDLAGHGKEGLLDIAGVLGRGLEERDSQAVGKLLLSYFVNAVHRIEIEIITQPRKATHKRHCG